MKIWLSSEQNPALNGHKDARWVKTVEEVIAFLETGMVTWLSLDNDLEADQNAHQVLGWLEDRALEDETFYSPDVILVQSKDTAAVRTMREAIKRIQRIEDNRS